MKTKTLSFTAILLATLFLTISCDNKEAPPEEKFPREIPFTEYSLEGTSCRWVNLPFDVFPFEVVIINSNEELEKYITNRLVGGNCTIEDIPAIDFSKYTLLLVRGNRADWAYIYSLRQLAAQEYEIKIHAGVFTQYGTTGMRRWFFPIIIDKLSSECTVELVLEVSVL